MIVKIGILAIQGGFLEHINAFKRCSEGYAKKDVKIELLELRNTNDLLDDIDGVVLPGGTLEVFFIFIYVLFKYKPFGDLCCCKASNFVRKRRWHRFFSVHFSDFLRTLFSRNALGRLRLYLQATTMWEQGQGNLLKETLLFKLCYSTSTVCSPPGWFFT